MLDIFGIIGTLFFGILSLILFINSQRTKQPMFFYRYMLLYTKKHPDVKILYQGQDLEYLSRALVFICNKGKKEIRKNDMPHTQLPSIQANEKIDILSASLLNISDDSINMTLDQKDNKLININFDYLNFNDGGIIEILLDGNIREIKKPLKFNATIIGAKKPKVKQFSSYDFSDKVFFISLTVGSLIFTLIMIYKGLMSIDSGLANYSYFGYAAISIVLGYLVHLISPFYKRVPKYARESME